MASHRADLGFPKWYIYALIKKSARVNNRVNDLVTMLGILQRIRGRDAQQISVKVKSQPYIYQ